MMKMGLLAIGAVLALGESAIAQTTKGTGIGIVWMHGKWGNPGKYARLAGQWRSAGMIVESPEMPWSGSRKYAKSYEGAMAEIDAAVARLNARGATRIVVGGHSMGANAALGYGARREGLAALLLLAPGHVPGLAGFDNRLADSVAKARSLVASGKGNTKGTFKDSNQGRVQSVPATAGDYLSWFDPKGPAVMPTNAEALKPGPFVYCVDGSREPRQRCMYVLSRLPRSVKRDRIVVEADHIGVPDAASGKLLAFLKGL